MWEGSSCPALGGIPLLSKLGEGGMGTVYFGIHPRLGAPVAVKVLPYHLAEKDPTLVDRFVREAQVAANVRSPHLVHVVDVNQDAGLYFLVMEYVCGQTGAKLLLALRKIGQVGFQQLQAIDTCIAASAGLKAAHALGVIHRDIKPDNIIIPFSKSPQTEGFNETVDVSFAAAKMMDLGLVRVQASNAGLTVTQSTMGTPGYMAPEQSMDAKSADQRSDIFSMGATLYALLAGRSPFQRESQVKTLFATVHDPPTPLKTYRTDIHGSVAAVIEKAMAKDPSGRYSSIDGFLAELRDAREMAAADRLMQVKPEPARQPVRPQPQPPSPAVSEINVAFVRSLIPHAAPAPDPVADKWRKRQRAAVLGALGLCAVLLGGMAYIVLRRPALTGQQLRMYRGEHERYVQAARKLADTGEFAAARTELDLADRLGLDDAAAKQAVLDAQNYLSEGERGWTRRYQQQLVAFDSIIESQALDNAPAALEELKKFAPADGSDAAAIAAKQQALDGLRKLREREDAVSKSLGEIAVLEPESALPRLNALRNALNDPELKPSNALTALDKRYHDLINTKLSAKNTVDRQRATEEQKQNFDALLAEADRAMTGGGSVGTGLLRADAKLAAAAKLFPADEELKNRRDKLDALNAALLREGKVAAALVNAGALIDKQAWDDADAALKEIDELAPGNPDAANLRAKSRQLQAEVMQKATEEQRRVKAAELFQKFDAFMNEGGLTEAEARLTAAAELDGASADFKSRQERLNQKKLEWKQQFDRLLKDAEDSLTDEARLAEAGKKIDEAARMAPDDKRLQGLREKFNQVKIAAGDRERARQKHEKLAQDLKALEESLPAAADPQADARLAAARTKFGELAHGNDSDALVKQFAGFLDQKQAEIRHVKFEALLKNAGETMDKDLAAAEKIFAAAREMFPDDAALKPARERLDVRVRFNAALTGLNDLLARNAKVEELEVQYAAAGKLRPNAAEADARLEPFRKEIMERRKQADFTALLNAASQDYELPSAQAALEAAAKLYPNDNRLADARQALAARQAAQQQRAQAQTYMQKLSNDVDGLMGSDSTLAEADTRVRDAERLYPGDPMLARLRGRINTRRAELHPAPANHDTRDTHPANQNDSHHAVDDIGEHNVEK